MFEKITIIAMGAIGTFTFLASPLILLLANIYQDHHPLIAGVTVSVWVGSFVVITYSVFSGILSLMVRYLLKIDQPEVLGHLWPAIRFLGSKEIVREVASALKTAKLDNTRS